MIWWVLSGALLLVIIACSWLVILSKRRSKRSVHVFLEDPIIPTRELAEDLAMREVHNCEEVIRDSRLFMYSIDRWPEAVQEHATSVVKKHNRWPKGNVVSRCTWGALQAGGKEYRWAVLQVFGQVKVAVQGG